MKTVFSIITILVIALSPLLIVTTALRIALGPTFVSFEYRLPNFPPDRYGFTQQERLSNAKIALNFLLGRVSIDNFASLEFPDGTNLYNSRETAHMADVLRLSLAMLNIWRILLVFFGGILIYSLTNDWLIGYAQAIKKGAAMTILYIAAILLAVAINFNELFTAFHKVFFEGDSWLFYNSDTLIRLFPIKFWQDLFVFIGVQCVAFSSLIILITQWFLKKRGNKPQLDT